MGVDGVLYVFEKYNNNHLSTNIAVKVFTYDTKSW